MTKYTEYYLFISNTDSAGTYSFNTPDLFTVDLCREYILPGRWSVALTEVCFENRFTSNIKYLCIGLNIVKPTFIKDQERSLLRKISVQGLAGHDTNLIFTQPYYFNICERNFQTLQFKLFNQDLNSAGFKGELSLVLHIKNNG